MKDAASSPAQVNPTDGCFDDGSPDDPVGLRTVSIGDVSVTALPDSAVLCDPGRFLSKHAASLQEEYEGEIDELPLIRLPTTCFLVRDGRQIVLVDAGIGDRGRPGQPMGYLDRRLQQAGVEPADVDVVINTHLHADHVGWFTIDGPGGPRAYLPNAKYVLQQREWDYWIDGTGGQPGMTHLDQCVRPLAELGCTVTFAQPSDRPTARLELIATPGHSPGHVSVLIESAGERGLILGDVSHHPFQLRHPDWSPIWDEDPEEAAETRERVFAECATDRRIVVAGHWPYPGFGRIEPGGGAFVFEPL